MSLAKKKKTKTGAGCKFIWKGKEMEPKQSKLTTSSSDSPTSQRTAAAKTP